MEEWETWVWFSTLPRGAKPGCGNVEISRFLRDFQGTVERVQKLLLLLHSFHGTVISTALCAAHIRGTWGDSILQRHNNSALAAIIFRAYSVSLIFSAV